MFLLRLGIRCIEPVFKSLTIVPQQGEIRVHGLAGPLTKGALENELPVQDIFPNGEESRIDGFDMSPPSFPQGFFHLGNKRNTAVLPFPKLSCTTRIGIKVQGGALF